MTPPTLRRFLDSCAALIVLAWVITGPGAASVPARRLRVAADPNNLPFSNAQGEGFENRLAERIAHDLGATLEYSWRAQRRGFFREAMREDSCDLVLGVPAGFERTLTTRPYYRSTYVFVTRRDAGLEIRSLDDPRLRRVRIGVPLTGDDGVNPPPAAAMARRGIVDNVRGWTLYGDYRRPDPPAALIAAVASGEIDVAVAWGPLAGWCARRSDVPLVVTPVEAPDEPLPFTYAIAVGVRKDEPALRDAVDAVLAARRDEIARLLDAYGIPRVPEPGATAKAAR